MERAFERILFAMRWLLAPLYIGLGLLLVLFAIQFFRESRTSLSWFRPCSWR